MKIVSRRTRQAIYKIPPEKLFDKKIITTARRGGYCCPMPDCSNGTGHDGTGITPKFDEKKDYWHWWCPVCEKNFNNLTIFKAHYQIADFNELAEKICADFDISPEYEEKDSPRFSRKRQTKAATSDEKLTDDELKIIRADLRTSTKPLEDFLRFGCDKNLWRGLPLDILLKFGCRYIHDWTTPKRRIIHNYDVLSPRMLIPCSNTGYLARLTCALDDFDDDAQKYIHEKEHAGRKKIFNAADLNSDGIVFAVEGYIDCMSVVYAGFKCVALGGAGEAGRLVDAVADMPVKPLIVVLFDPDKTGRTKASVLVDDLISVGCPAVARFLSEENSKIDCNQILDERGVDELRDILTEIHDDAASELAAVVHIIEERKAKRIAAKVDDLLQGGVSDDEFAYRLKNFCGGDVRWLTDDEKWLMYRRNVHGGAVWQRGSEKNSALLPFAQKMSDIMTEYADNDDERKLVESFKSSKKRLQSITLLKGHEDLLITADDLNREPFLLNCLNGVIDLTTGKLIPAAPELLLTQQCAAVFDPNCTDTTFADFLKSVMPDDDTREAIIRFFGYCMTADVSKEKFLLIYGTGGNGKGVLLLTLRSLLKDYAVELPPDTVLENRGRLTADANGRATTEISPLATRRLGIVDELPRGGRWDIAKMNRLTGGDTIPIRKLYNEGDEIAPSHKLIMAGNYRPQIDDTRDAALLRRLMAVKFERDFTQNPDTSLKARLQTSAALSGALNVLIPAAVEFCKHGLLEPSKAMKRARAEHLSENDFVGDYLAEFCEFGDGFSVTRKALLNHMRDNCRECARHRDSDLAAMLAKVDGVTYRQSHKIWTFYGIKLASKKNDSGGILSSDDYPPWD